jgi:hypothetical protein
MLFLLEETPPADWEIKMNTYQIELPDGQIRRYNSKRVYTHGIAMLLSDNSAWDCWGTSSSHALAEKAAKSYASKVERTSKGAVTAKFQIVELTVVA